LTGRMVQKMSELKITINERLSNIHPGEVLKEEFLGPMNIWAFQATPIYSRLSDKIFFAEVNSISSILVSIRV